jgi:hypothetical protein
MIIDPDHAISDIKLSIWPRGWLKDLEVYKTGCGRGAS